MSTGAPGSWPFEYPPNMAVFTAASILDGTAWIALVMHDDDDGNWQFLPNFEQAPPDDAARIVALAEILRRDPSLAELMNLPEGWIAWRESPAAAWTRETRDNPS